MSQSLANNILHLVFSTKERKTFLEEKRLREELYRYMIGIAQRRKCAVIAVGAVADHIHILFRLSPDLSLSDFVRDVKRGSSSWLKGKGLPDFSWQNGYGAFSLGTSQLEAAEKYINSQDKRHRTISFKDELRTLLRKTKTAFDEQYLWT